MDLSENEIVFSKQLKTFNSLTSLIVSNNKLTEIPIFFTELTNLKKLDVSRNQIALIPQILTVLKDLQDLNISNNRITEIPLFIDSFEKLRQFDCSYNDLDHLPKALVNMKIINFKLSGNKFDNVPTPIPQMSLLTHLDLSENQITSIPEICRQLSHLQSLDLHSNLIDSFSTRVFEKMTKMTKLNFRDNPFKVIPEINSLIHLKELYYSNITDPIDRKFPSVSINNELENIELINSSIEEFPSLLNLTKMTLLYLHKNEITSIKDIPRRCSVDASFNKISEITIQKYADLPVLKLDHNNFIQTPNLSQCEKVQLLDLSYNNISTINDFTFHTSIEQLILNNNPLRIPPIGITKCSHLTLLSMSNCEIYSIPIDVVSGLCNLKILDISNNHIISYEHFEYLNKLEELRASSNNMSFFPKEFCEMSQMKVLIMNNNKIKVIPESIKELQQLESLDLSYNQIREFSILELNKKLKELNLSFNLIIEYPNLSQWNQLEEFNIIGNSLVNFFGLVPYCKKTKIITATYNIQRIKQPTLELTGILDDKLIKKIPEIVANANEFKSKKVGLKLLQTPKESMLFNIDSYKIIGIGISRGNEKYMKSTICVARNIFTNGILVGSFEGILGGRTARLCSYKFVDYFLNKVSNKVVQESIEESLISTFQRLNEKIKEKNLNDVSSGLVYVFYNKILYFAQCGSIKSYIISNSNIKEIGFDHCLSNNEMKKKIMQKGGLVDNNNMLNGVINVCKCIGESNYHNLLNTTPDITKIEYDDDFKFVLTASKSVWDVIDQNELQSIVINSAHIQPPGIANLIRNIALERNCKGNISVTILSLDSFIETNNEET
ncbi:leucine rich repeat / protein phosphatase 2C domain containing protein [Entamoeba histolytica HM-1:IMSS-B]|uniref:Leucine rich repeat / protein phosphatase 2C domain containing protein n=4 Tax=Entamoeba histolytica TaxID=5759 RepID=C4LXT5_ENTH1|nr:leucine rich repeat / protein phosphatase 2C domain containing protein [Entamoeba histolytica HM-1:IMSS]EAL45976.1 leucine rich repeat / protein phosphatase 2C domain containing protein [Entamoeba histolytica HM-1:IMSS]EMH76286.1 leucine rich repeat / protein phosphatase 2C domain containing protein [Entamoeba histolytica HM-1:IMSS-B]ENY61893.1 leucine rich repeat-containing protein [Entamoeba histolytica HM-1:IMSS-A]GAT93585.1 leucine rich repeat protein phosphatase 2c domain containing pro|eukprot:XP_651364.1 leucine rich repeat / protein phosphatase 2C domain containing protein [Entamoeba histolytica HM-1:IMSS]